MASRTSVGTLVLAIAIFLTPKASEACSCVDIQRTEEQRAEEFRAEYGRAIAVFVGRATGDDGYQATFEVRRVWKGDLSERAVVQTGVRPANPGVVTISSGDYHFAAGKTYLVFAYGTASQLKSQCCSPTNQVDLAAEALQRLKSIASPRPPHQRIEPPRR
jgi:hypothetical protein